MIDESRLLVSLLTVVALTLGGGLLPLVRDWDRSTIRLLLAFGTGVLLGAAFLHMIPESVDRLGHSVGFPVLLGFLLIYVLERFVMVHACEEEHCSFHHMGIAAFVGITLHALIDGVALGAGMAIPSLTTAVTAAIVLHKLPATLSLTGILLHCNYPRKRIVWMVLGFSLATPMGALLAYSALAGVADSGILPYAIAFSAGTFLAIATADLLPQVHSAPAGRYKSLVALFAGIALMSWGGHFGHGHEAGAGDDPAGDAQDHAGHDHSADEAPDGH
jgi:zinc and cadmium transporter